MKRNTKKYLYDKNKFVGEETLSTSSLYAPNSEKIITYIKKSYFHKQYTNRGPLVKELEEKLLKFHNTEHCITYCNSFWALLAAIKILALKNRKYILMPSLTSERVYDAVIWSGFTPIYCEIDPINLGIDINTIDYKYLKNIALILAVHPMIDCLNSHRVSEFALSVSIPVIFDSIQSVNESLPEGKVGKYGNCEIFSLHGSKLINGLEGGYITTNDINLYNELRKFQNFSFNSRGELTEKYSMNAKLNEGHAAFALASLDDLNILIEHNYSIYKEYLHAESLVTGKFAIRKYNPKMKPSYMVIAAELNKTYMNCIDELMLILNSIDILSRHYYFPPLHKKSGSKVGTKDHKLFHTDLYSKNLFLLPSGWQIKKEQIYPLMKLINEIINNIFTKKHNG